MADTATDPSIRPVRAPWSAAIPLMAGAGIAVALGAYGRIHDPTGRSLYTGFFTSTTGLKAWLTTGCLALAVTQPMTGRWLRWSGATPSEHRDKPAQTAPSWLGDLHRLIGTLIFGLSLPVAFHCLWALGYQSPDFRVAAHGLIGCAFYGAFAAKEITVRRADQPAWAVPVWGALIFGFIVAIWWTGALWYFDNVTWSP